MTGQIGDTIAEAAEQLVGTKFRLRGRDRDTGVDCVGVVLIALRKATGVAVEFSDYQLRNTSIDQFLPIAKMLGLKPVAGAIMSGDVLLIKLGLGQWHLMIAASNNQFVHAHAGLRRVVAMPGPIQKLPEQIWRIRENN